MSRDEILNMPSGEELNALVAEKVMGWHKGKYAFPDGTIIGAQEDWLDADNRFMHGIKQDDGWTEDDEDFHLLHWHPSESILWAWDVIEEMSAKGYWCYMGVLSSHCYCGFMNGIDDYDLMRADAPTYDLPLAICRAALLTVMKLEEE